MPEISGSGHSSKKTRGRRGSEAAASATRARPAASSRASAAPSSARPTAAVTSRIVWRISATERWFVTRTGTPRRTRSLAMSACRSEKPTTSSGRSARIASASALRKDETLGFRRASGGRTVNPDTPTTSSPAPIR